MTALRIIRLHLCDADNRSEDFVSHASGGVRQAGDHGRREVVAAGQGLQKKMLIIFGWALNKGLSTKILNISNWADIVQLETK